MKTKDSDLIIITKTKNLITYIMTITEKSPVKFRYSFVQMHIKFNLYSTNKTLHFEGFYLYLLINFEILNKIMYNYIMNI